jgi:arginase
MRGAAEAPAAIREALASDASNSWSETGVETGAPGALRDAGDVALGDPAKPDAAHARSAIETRVARLLADGVRPIALGGDHSVTYPVLRAVRTHHPRLTVVHVDAHPDLYAEFLGDRFSHACPFARVMDETLCDRLVQVGIRAMNDHQREQARRFGVEVIEMRDWRDGRRIGAAGPVYISFDLDALDPAFAPGVSHREPGGLSVRQALDLLHGLEGDLIGADLVELNPRRDVSGMSATVCAKLVKELAGMMLRPPPRGV